MQQDATQTQIKKKRTAQPCEIVVCSVNVRAAIQYNLSRFNGLQGHVAAGRPQQRQRQRALEWPDHKRAPDCWIITCTYVYTYVWWFCRCVSFLAPGSSHFCCCCMSPIHITASHDAFCINNMQPHAHAFTAFIVFFILVVGGFR